MQRSGLECGESQHITPSPDVVAVLASLGEAQIFVKETEIVKRTSADARYQESELVHA
jgi:hypothetical protein